VKLQFRASAATLFALGLIALAPFRSEAGFTSTPFSYCYKAADGSGYCQGTLAGFRANSDPNAWASLTARSAANGQWGWFYASINGSFYSCSAFSSPVIARFGNAATAPSAVFTVFWSASGECTQLETQATSYYQ
jgi:hypothetical protein